MRYTMPCPVLPCAAQYLVCHAGAPTGLSNVPCDAVPGAAAAAHPCVYHNGPEPCLEPALPWAQPGAVGACSGHPCGTWDLGQGGRAKSTGEKATRDTFDSGWITQVPQVPQVTQVTQVTQGS